jgi:hypothetical protein
VKGAAETQFENQVAVGSSSSMTEGRRRVVTEYLSGQDLVRFAAIASLRRVSSEMSVMWS